MDPVSILAVLTTGAEVIRLLVQGVSFVERLWNGQSGHGSEKKEMVMQFASVAFVAFGGDVDKEKWEKAKPHVSIIIDEIVAVLNILK